MSPSRYIPLLTICLFSIQAHAEPPKGETDKQAAEPTSDDKEKPVNALDEFEERSFPKPDGPEPTAQPESLPAVEQPSIQQPSPKHVEKNVGESSSSMDWLSNLTMPDVPMFFDEKVIRYLEFYRSNARGRRIMRHWIKRQGRYEKMISKLIKRFEMPKSLIYVAMVESGYDPSETSAVGAAGMWQFMVQTGQKYGLKRDSWIDERRDPERSTEAALQYLKSLYSSLGSWNLSLAAYHAGLGAIVNAIKKYNTNDYWQLCRYEAGLPWSTTLYVPKILAAMIVGHNRAFFGFSNIKPDPELAYELVSIPTSLTKRQLAQAAGVSTDIISELNPELRRERTPPNTSLRIRIPQGARHRFYSKLASGKGALSHYRPYVVRLGDTDESLAKLYDVSYQNLRQINQLTNSAELRPGITILVPAAKRTHIDKDTEINADEKELILVSLPEGSPTEVVGHKRVFYRVASGDSLDEIAHYLAVTKDDLIHWNAIDPNAKLIPEMVLQAFVPDSFDNDMVRFLDPDSIKVLVSGSEEFLTLFEKRKGRNRFIYTVRKGDDLKKIGRRFNLSVGSLMRINQFARNTTLEQGQKIVLYAEPKKTKVKPSKTKNGKAKLSPDKKEAAKKSTHNSRASKKGATRKKTKRKARKK
ncbi:MAG: LysM peptidoglycan-binding domain-containing protein [Pseudomonadota bacterium]